MEVAEPTELEHPPGSRILYVITKARWGGAQRYVYELAHTARARGMQVAVACGTQGELTQRLVADGIPVKLVSGLSRDVRLGADMRAVVSLYRFIRTYRPDIVHANSSKAGFIGALAARLARVKLVIFTAHGWSFNERRPAWQRRIFALLHLLTALLAHRIICVSGAIARDAAWMPWIQNRFTVIRHGMGPLPQLPRAEARKGLEARCERTLPSTALWVGSLAELHPTKGLDMLIQAFATIAETAPETVLVLIGSGQDRGRLTALAHQLRIEERVFFCGHVPDGAQYLSALDIFVLPSHSEALGYALLEAGVAGVASVGSNVGGIPEIITDRESGLLVPPGDVPAFAHALQTLIENAALRDQLGKALHEKVAIDFSEEQMLDQTFSLYRYEPEHLQKTSDTRHGESGE